MQMTRPLITAAVLFLLAGCGAEADAEDDERPSAPSSTSTATGAAAQQLAELTVEPENRSGYDRDLFPHWSSQGGGCDTREVVLQRDGDGVEVDDDCYPTAGSWTSPYDGGTWTQASDVDIDHVVPLAEAWDSGASQWSTDEREAFANDVDRPQLLAVTDNVNQEKSDQDPAEWMPPITGYHCTYATDWITVKRHYQLSVDEEEKTALEETLNRC